MTKQERTEILLNRERGGKNEWTRLHAILCMDHGFETADGGVFLGIDEAVDLVAIARRLDELTKEALASVTP